MIRDRKLVFLLALGISITIFGIISITNAQFVEIYEFDKHGQILQPIPITIPLDTKISKNLISSFDLIKIHFYTNDVFVAGYPIFYEIDITLREPDSIDELYLIYREPDQTISHVNDTNFEEFLEVEKSLGNVYELEKITPNNFYLKGERKFQFEHEFGFSLVGKTQSNRIEPLDMTHETLVIDESVKKIQIDVARAELLSTIKQSASNWVIQGFSAIIVGWIPLELFVQLYREKRKENKDRLHAINAIISEFTSTQNHFKTKKPIVEMNGNNIVGLHPTIFSTVGLENALLNGAYQEFENDDREEVSRIYLEFTSLTKLAEQIQSVAFLSTIEKSQKFTHLQNLSKAYEKKYEVVNTDIGKFLPKLNQYKNKFE